MLNTLLVIIILGLFAWFWLDGLKTKETAKAAALNYVDTHHLQILDDTVLCKKTRINLRHFCITRLYQIHAFDPDGEKDLHIPIHMQGHAITQIGSENTDVVNLSDYRAP
jgi:hypothetical protein